LPTSAEWRSFLERLLAWMGAVLLATALIFFLAYNWETMGRYAKLALAQGALLVALGFVWWLGLERAAGKATLLAAALLAGALFALIGQIYQTGADTFELFAAWALAILPWVLLGRFAALWLVWIVLLNLAITLYFHAFGGIFGLLFGPRSQLWLLFGVNTAALAIWELAARAGVEWLRERWAARILAFASGGFVTALALFDVFGWRAGGGLGWLVWLAWLACAYAVYRRRIRDLFVLAGGVLSVVIVSASFLGKHLARGEPVGLLFVAVVVIGLSAAGGWWLKKAANEEAS
jgi:uncharacterized membrane protein